MTDFIFLGSKIIADGDCCHELKRRLLLARKAMTNLDSVLKSRDTWRRNWQPTPVFLLGESHGQRSLVGYSPQVTKSRTRLSDFTFTFTPQLRLSALVFATDGFLEFSKTCDHILFYFIFIFLFVHLFLLVGG